MTSMINPFWEEKVALMKALDICPEDSEDYIELKKQYQEVETKWREWTYDRMKELERKNLEANAVISKSKSRIEILQDMKKQTKESRKEVRMMQEELRIQNRMLRETITKNVELKRMCNNYFEIGRKSRKVKKNDKKNRLRKK